MRSILIATLGEPAAWERVEYIYGNVRCKTKSTLPVLLDAVSPKPDAAVAIAMDTAVDGKVASYDELVDAVRSKYERFFEEVGLSGRVRLVVAPGAGRFRARDGTLFNFVGRLSDYRAYVTYELSKALLEGAEPEATIHLDLTHGVNFMPSLTALAVRDVAGALALAQRSVRLVAYNAEPYVRGVTGSLNIHEVEDYRAAVEYDLVPLGASGKCSPLKRLVEGPICLEEDYRTLASKCEQLRRELNAFVSSIFNGLPLALYTFYPDVDELGGLVEELVEVWRENVSVAAGEGWVEVRRGLSFERDFVKLVRAHLIAKALGLRREEEVSLEELDELRKGLFSRLSKRADIMISRDLNLVRDSVGSPMGWTRLRDLEAFRKRASEGFDPRNFLAHSGLEANVTEVKYDGRSIMLRYVREEVERVAEACVDGLLKPA